MKAETINTNDSTITDCISYLSNTDPKLAKVIATIGEIDHQHYKETNPFVFLSREIIGQMISAKVKKTLYGRFVKLCNDDVSPETVSLLSVADLRSIGLSTSKSQYLLNLARVVSEGQIDFNELYSDSDEIVIKKLTSIKGIGKWTANMFLLFFLEREDVLPVEDGAFLQAYKWLYSTDDVKPSSIRRNCNKWSPYSSIASRYMYRALDSGLTKIDIQVFLHR